jgi:hypothetical protein
MKGRTAVGVIALLVVGVAVGLVIRSFEGVDWLFVPKGVRAIVVGPAPGDLTAPKLKLSKKDAHVVFWVAKTPTDKLSIQFRDRIFKNMTQLANGRYQVQCPGGRWCYSDEILPSASYDVDYKYWQLLTDASGAHEADGHIIIKP